MNVNEERVDWLGVAAAIFGLGVLFVVCAVIVIYGLVLA